MLASMKRLLSIAHDNGYAIGAFNVYNFEGVKAAVLTAEESNAPIIIQIHAAGIDYGGQPLMALCKLSAQTAKVPIAVHLDHNSNEAEIRNALDHGITSIMADGSHLPYEENVAFTQRMADLIHSYQGAVEGELGRLAGTEDGLSVPEVEARMTDPDQAAEFINKTSVDALAVCIGNIHGHYWREPQLDFARLEAINNKAQIPLVLHGASGIPADQVKEAIRLGISKVNVNTEVREAFVSAIGEMFVVAGKPPELLAVLNRGVAAMKDVIQEKINFFGSAGKADHYKE